MWRTCPVPIPKSSLLLFQLCFVKLENLGSLPVLIARGSEVIKMLILIWIAFNYFLTAPSLMRSGKWCSKRFMGFLSCISLGLKVVWDVRTLNGCLQTLLNERVPSIHKGCKSSWTAETVTRYNIILLYILVNSQTHTKLCIYSANNYKKN